MQPRLRVPRRVGHRLGQTFLPRQNRAADPRRTALVPRRLDQRLARDAVAHLRNPALLPVAARRVFARTQPEITHQLRRGGEPFQVDKGELVTQSEGSSVTNVFRKDVQ